MTDSYRRTNGGGETVLVLGGLAVAGYFLYEWWMANQAAASAVAIPATSNTTVAIQSAATTNPDLQYAISANDLTNIYAILNTNYPGIASGGLAAWNYWAQSYTFLKGVNLPAGIVATVPPQFTNGTPISGSEFANAVNSWVNQQGLSGLGTIGANYGPPPQVSLGANRFQIINAWGR